LLPVGNLLPGFRSWSIGRDASRVVKSTVLWIPGFPDSRFSGKLGEGGRGSVALSLLGNRESCRPSGVVCSFMDSRFPRFAVSRETGGRGEGVVALSLLEHRESCRPSGVVHSFMVSQTRGFPGDWGEGGRGYLPGLTEESHPRAVPWVSLVRDLCAARISVYCAPTEGNRLQNRVACCRERGVGRVGSSGGAMPRRSRAGCVDPAKAARRYLSSAKKKLVSLFGRPYGAWIRLAAFPGLRFACPGLVSMAPPGPVLCDCERNRSLRRCADSSLRGSVKPVEDG